MYTELIGHIVFGKPEVMQVVRIVDGKVHITGDVPDGLRKELEYEYEAFKKKFPGKGDEGFLKDRLAMHYVGSSRIETRFHPEG